MLGARHAATLPAPVVTMVSYAIVYRHGLARYVDDAQRAGVAGAIVPDLLVEESGELAKICRRADFSLCNWSRRPRRASGPCGSPKARPASCTTSR